MNEKIMKRLAGLISVKSIVTLTLTAVFAYLAITHFISADDFKSIFYIIIAFYFGTQTQKISDAVDKTSKEEK